MSFRELAEITHFHLFTMPVVFMILVHVLYLTNASNRLKIVTTWISFGGYPGPHIPVADQLCFSCLRIDYADRRYVHDGGILGHVCDPAHEMWILKQPLMAGKRGEHG